MTDETAAALARIQEASFARASEATRNAFPPERRMTGEALAAYLGAKRYAILGTVRPDGRPHAAPVGYALVGTRFVIGTLPDAQRVRNVRHQPSCSLVVTHGEDDEHVVVIAEGTARLIEPMDAPLEVRAPFRDDEGALASWVGLLMVVTPERLLSYAAPGAIAPDSP
ncbi:MAG TPA: pyridoxamine 5'-phosphate oxidase family protein [Actinomycetota bacterium]